MRNNCSSLILALDAIHILTVVVGNVHILREIVVIVVEFVIIFVGILYLNWEGINVNHLLISIVLIIILNAFFNVVVDVLIIAREHH